MNIRYIGDTFTVAFSLDDEAQTVIVDDIVVCYSHNGAIGAKYMSRNGYNPEIDFYLMNVDDKDVCDIEVL